MLRRTSLSLVFYFCLLLASKSSCRTLIGSLWFTLSCYVVAKVILAGASLDPPPPSQAGPYLSLKLLRSRVGKHTWADCSCVSRLLKCAHVTYPTPSPMPRALLNKVWQEQKRTLFYNIFGRASKMQKQLISRVPETLHNVAAASDTKLGFDGSPRSPRREPRKC